ncbi:MAG TPA: putative peptidoglycan glycosyltransferase FtsW [Novosphingobium sp.]|nr:putative peptidoglycan glycosyltransferase FtsW [Novosphingobium sp.]
MATRSPDRVASPQFAMVEKYRRNRRGELAIWWRETDRWLLLLVLTLMAIGTAAVAAASPASARRLSTDATSLSSLHFFALHVRWQLIGIAAMLGASFLGKDAARRAGILIAAFSVAGLLLVPVIGTEVNGARRWLNLGISIQPSSLLTAGFPITLAWILSWRMRDPNLPVIELSFLFVALVAALLMIQPDFGSTILFSATWFAMILLAGLSVRRILMTGAFGLAGLTAVYFLYGNARHRIDAFFDGGAAFDQVDLAQRTLLNGGWTGTGFWLGERKMALPEAHTDYIFSVIGEEFGLLACAVVVLIYFAIVFRVLLRLVEEEDLFTVLAAGGLAAQFGGQAFINILVNLQLFPSKGMTLPLISYGGSSTVAMCLTLGLLLAITRRNPFIQRRGISLNDVGGIS